MKSFQITPTRRRICRPLIRKNYQSFSNQCAQNACTRKAMIKTVSCILSREIAGICSDKHHSVVRSKSIEVLSSFDCKEIIDELCSHAPTLLSLLRACLKTKAPRSNEDLILAVISGIILKHRRPSCSLIQQVISLILYAGHSAKQVCNTIHANIVCIF